jgi:transposase
MWTCENRPKYNRDKLRYPSDLTDEERSHVAPLIRPAKHGGRKRKVDVREVVLMARRGLRAAMPSVRDSKTREKVATDLQ